MSPLLRAGQPDPGRVLNLCAYLEGLRLDREALERRLDEVREQTRDAVREGAALGLTNRRMSEMLGISEMHVGRLRR